MIMCDSDNDFQESGPFCRHMSDPSVCDETCDICGHKCSVHNDYGLDGSCTVEGCTCTQWKEKDD